MARQEMGVVVDNGSFDVEESGEAVGTKKVLKTMQLKLVRVDLMH